MLRVAVALACLVFAGAAGAHSFGQTYTLPIPVSLYQYAAVAALLLSFAVTYFMHRVPPAGAAFVIGLERTTVWLRRWRLPLLARLVVAGLLLLAIVAGLWGRQDPYRNINMTLFWIIFLLGGAYCCALAGNIQRLLNPWRCLVELLPDRLTQQVRLRYPARLGHWPAVLIYAGLVWLELFGGVTPLQLSWLLLAYSLFTVLASALFGADVWFRQGEIFSLFFRLLARVSPLHWRGQPARLVCRLPLRPAEQDSTQDFSLLVFILVLLAATAFDGLHETQVWHRLYWVDLYRNVLQPYVGSNPFVAFSALRQGYVYWQSAWLILFPLLYLTVFLLCIALVRRLGQIRAGLPFVAAAFAPSLLPIVLVYHVAHYYTLLQTQGVKIISLASDPLGLGWDLFGTAVWLQYSIVPNLGTVWHAQVLLIVAGHVLSVFAAHWQALALCDTPRRALVSQLPMLLLMMAFTASGLWILAQPLQA